MGQRQAVIVGVNRCPDDALIPDLRYAEADALALRNLLVDPHTGTFDRDEVHLLTGEDATTAKVTEMLRGAALSAEPADVLLVYFAGHGLIAPWDEQDVYLVTSDFDSSRLRLLPDRGMRMKTLRQDVFELSKGSTFLVLDCCHAGAFAHTAGRMEPSGALLRALAAHETQLSQHTALMACPHDETTRESDELGHGVFSHRLLQGLRGQAAGDDGHVTFANLASFVRQHDGHPHVGLFAKDWGPTTVLTRPKLNLRASAVDLEKREPDVKFVSSVNPLQCHAPLVRQLLDRLFRTTTAVQQDMPVLDRVCLAVEAESAAIMEFGPHGTHVTATSTDFRRGHLEGLFERIAARITAQRRSALGHLSIEDSGRQVLAVPLSNNSRDGSTVLLVVNAARPYLELGEPLASMLRAFVRTDGEELKQAEVDVLTTLREVHGRLPLDLYGHALDLYRDVLLSVGIVFEPVFRLNQHARGVAVHSYEALARRGSGALRAPVSTLEAAQTWGDQFLIERDATLAVKAVQSYAEAYDRSRNDHRHLPFSINVAVRTLLSDAYATQLEAAIQLAGLNADQVTLEISEQDPIAPATDEEWLPDPTTFFRERLLELTRRIGVKFAVDDFGVGHASLDRLSTLTLTQIKVDRAILTHDVELAKEELKLVVKIAEHAMSNSGASAPRPIIVEGVDDQIKLSLYDIHTSGINYVQGYITELRASQDLPIADADLRERIASKVRGEDGNGQAPTTSRSSSKSRSSLRRQS